MEEMIIEETIYLDNAATSFPKPDVVRQQMATFCRQSGVNPGRSGCDLGLRAEAMVFGTRNKLTDFFNRSLVEAGVKKDPNRLCFTPNATASLNLIVNGTLHPGDHVVTTIVEHNSVIRPVNHAVKRGVEATYIGADPEGYVNPEDIRQAIKNNTRLVIVNHASNVIGVVQDMQAIGAVCREEGVPFAVDVAQTAGILPIDMPECNISFLAFTGHKGLFGPTGIGGICVADDAEIEFSLYGGTGVRSAHPYHIEEWPHRLEAGTQNLGGIAGLSAAQDWLAEKGIENIYNHEIRLLAMLMDGLMGIQGVTLYGHTRTDRRVAVCSFNIEGRDPSEVGTYLDVDYSILTRTGLECAPLIHKHIGTFPKGTVRFSIGPFNTETHIEHAIRSVAEIAKQASR
jgi:cysteine desulfurase family protein